jgi:hypothetical protein
VRSPISSVRSQIAHTLEVLTRVTLTRRGYPIGCLRASKSLLLAPFVTD